ncbi:hypothetical protein [Dyella jiangningensis]|uniref:hypothetical protein n=1 Tax=Dyella jiangningensis TaxID=1379159 RepID=UPI0011BE2564|nr:hypothetical protein [Dyella jiangningensis]
MAIDRETQVLNAGAAAGVTSPRELANFMAQTAYESLGLNRLDDDSGIPVEMNRSGKGSVAARAGRTGTSPEEALRGKPEHLAGAAFSPENRATT